MTRNPFLPVFIGFLMRYSIHLLMEASSKPMQEGATKQIQYLA